jgi:hypothetical protein
MADVAARSEGLRASALSVKLEIGLTANDWKLEIILDVKDEALGGVGQDFDHGNLFDYGRVGRRELEGGVGHSGYGWMRLQAKGLCCARSTTSKA